MDSLVLLAILAPFAAAFVLLSLTSEPDRRRGTRPLDLTRDEFSLGLVAQGLLAAALFLGAVVVVLAVLG